MTWRWVNTDMPGHVYPSKHKMTVFEIKTRDRHPPVSQEGLIHCTVHCVSLLHRLLYLLGCIHQNVTVYTGLREATWIVLFWCLLSQMRVMHWSSSAVITSILIMFTYSHWMLNLNFTVCSKITFNISEL